MEKIRKFIESLLSSTIEIGTTSSPPMLEFVIVGLILCAVQVFLIFDIQQLVWRVNSWNEARRRNKYSANLLKAQKKNFIFGCDPLERKTEPQLLVKRPPVHQSEPPNIIEEISICKSIRSNLCLKPGVEDLAFDIKVAYLASVTPSQFIRDEMLLARRSTILGDENSSTNCLSSWTGSEMSTDDTWDDDSYYNYYKSIISLAGKKHLRVMSSMPRFSELSIGLQNFFRKY